MASDHPLAGRPNLRLRDCAAYPVALPQSSIGGRQLLNEVMARTNLRLDIVAQSNSFEFLRNLVRRDKVISFQIKIGTLDDDEHGLIARDIDDRDVPRADLVFGQLRGRNLSVPAAKFAEQLVTILRKMRTEATPPLKAKARA